jgi:thiamine pyrophosphate-dependent acetolactate synthase large subunit-like protein
VTAVAAAQSDGSPVLLMSGEVSTLVEGLGMFQDASPQTLDDVEIVKPIVRHSSSIDNPRKFAASVQARNVAATNPARWPGSSLVAPR